jgi:hypothetical protein
VRRRAVDQGHRNGRRGHVDGVDLSRRSKTTVRVDGGGRRVDAGVCFGLPGATREGKTRGCSWLGPTPKTSSLAGAARSGRKIIQNHRTESWSIHKDRNKSIPSACNKPDSFPGLWSAKGRSLRRGLLADPMRKVKCGPPRDWSSPDHPTGHSVCLLWPGSGFCSEPCGSMVSWHSSWHIVGFCRLKMMLLTPRPS